MELIICVLGLRPDGSTIKPLSLCSREKGQHSLRGGTLACPHFKVGTFFLLSIFFFPSLDLSLSSSRSFYILLSHVDLLFSPSFIRTFCLDKEKSRFSVILSIHLVH